METEQKIDEETTSPVEHVKAEIVPEPDKVTGEEQQTTESKPDEAVTDNDAVTQEVPAEAMPAVEEPVAAAPLVEAVVEVAAPEAKETKTVEVPHIPTEYPKGATFASLLYSTENNGELFMQWGDAPHAKALAVFTTMKKIPPFKMKKPIPMLTHIGNSRKKFITGLASFFKEVDSNDGVFRILDVSDAGFGDVWVSIGGKKWGKEAGVPKKIRQGEDCDINSIEALVILPHASAVFDGLLKIDIMRFLNTGTREGAAWHRS